MMDTAADSSEATDDDTLGSSVAADVDNNGNQGIVGIRGSLSHEAIAAATAAATVTASAAVASAATASATSARESTPSARRTLQRPPSSRSLGQPQQQQSIHHHRRSSRASPVFRRLHETGLRASGQFGSQKSLRHFLTKEVLPHADHYRHRLSFPEGEGGGGAGLLLLSLAIVPLINNVLCPISKKATQRRRGPPWTSS